MFEIVEKKEFKSWVTILYVVFGIVFFLGMIILTIFFSIFILRLINNFFNSINDIVIVLVFIFNLSFFAYLGFLYDNNILYKRIDKVKIIGFFELLDEGLKINDRIIPFGEIMKIEIHRSIGFGKSFLTKEKRCVKFKLITNKSSETLLIKHLAINDKKLEINELFVKLKLKKTLYKKIFIYV